MPPKMHTKLKPIKGFEKKGYLSTDAAWNTLQDLNTRNRSVKEIAELCGCDRKTVRYNLASPPPSVREQNSRVSPAKKTEQKKRRKKIKSLLGRKKKSGVPCHNSARRLCFAVRQDHPCSKSTVNRDLHAMDVTYSKRPLIPAGVATTDDWAALRVITTSPDLNPIENMWALVSREVEKAMPIASKDELWGVVLFFAAWDAVSQQTVDKLVKSFPHRVNILLAKKRHESPKIGKNRVSGRKSPPHGLKVAYFGRSRNFALKSPPFLTKGEERGVIVVIARDNTNNIKYLFGESCRKVKSVITRDNKK